MERPRGHQPMMESTLAHIWARPPQGSNPMPSQAHQGDQDHGPVGYQVGSMRRRRGCQVPSPLAVSFVGFESRRLRTLYITSPPLQRSVPSPFETTPIIYPTLSVDKVVYNNPRISIFAYFFSATLAHPMTLQGHVTQAGKHWSHGD
jgi:hypothetical protein